MNGSTDVTIRQARAEDEDRLAEIIVRAFGGSTLHAKREARYGVLGGKTWQERKAWEIVQVLRRNPELIVVAEVEGQVAGFCSYSIHDNEHGEIRNNAVDPNYQGRGIGHALHRRVLEIMREKGCKYAEVETGQDEPYARARAAYEKLGFEPYHYAVRYTMELGMVDG